MKRDRVGNDIGSCKKMMHDHVVFFNNGKEMLSVILILNDYGTRLCTFFFFDDGNNASNLNGRVDYAKEEA